MTNYSLRSESFLIRENYLYLIDAGRSKNGEHLLKKYGCKSILDCFVISHGDNDHIGLANIVIEELEPEIIILSPLVYILEKFRFTFNPVNLNIPRLFGDEYSENIELIEDIDKNEYNENRIGAVYLQKNTSNISENWKINNNSRKEFEAFPTLKACYYTKLINDFIVKVSSYTSSTPSWINAVNSHELIKDLRNGKLLRVKKYNLNKTNFSLMWNEIETAILKKLKNEMSLVCRIGSTYFTGDATKKQLQEIENVLFSQSKSLGKITIKINHHGSVNSKYEYLDFYKKMQPTQLLLKRDYQIQGSKTSPKPRFDNYVKNLEGIVSKKGLIDSKVAENQGRNFEWFKTF